MKLTKIKKLLFFLLFLLFSSFLSFSQSENSSSKSERPSVGLVFSGGGAKGWAYVGLLRVIQEAGLPIDYIAGASAGSIVGGFYALGYHPDTMEMLIREQDWDALMQDKIDRKYIDYEDKIYGGRYIFSLPIKKKKIGLSASLYEGQNIDLLLNRYYSVAYKDTLFKNFQTPFICVATNLLTGEEEVLNSGYLPQAIRSSMSIPGYFSPTEYKDKLLVDGGVVDNYPAVPLKDLGVDIIVGADVQSGVQRTREDLDNLATVIDQIIGFNRQAANVKGKEETDLYIHMKMSYNMMDFNNYDSIISFGQQVANDHFDELKALADSLNAIEYKPVKTYNTVPLDSIFIDAVKYTGYEKMPRKFLEGFFGDFEGEKIAISDLETAINYAYGTGFFKSVFYELQYENGKTYLLIKIQDSDPGSLSAGIHYDTDYKGAILVNLGVRNLFVKRSKFFIDLSLGNYPLLRGLYVIENGAKPGIGIDFEMYSFDFATYVSDKKNNEWEFDNFSASAFVPITIKNKFGLKLGFQYEYFRFKQTVVIDSSQTGYDTFSSFGQLYFAFGGDTRDKSYFPTRGSLIRFKALYSIPFSKNWNQEVFDNALVLYLKYKLNIRLAKRLTLQPGLFLGAAFNRNGAITFNSIADNDYIVPVPVQNRFFFGGLNNYNYVDTFVPFTGLKFVQNQGIYAALFRLNLQYNFWRKLYATAMFDFGQNQLIWDDFWNVDYFMAGYGVKLSYDSFIGPVEFSVMGSNVLPGANVFLSVGFWL